MDKYAHTKKGAIDWLNLQRQHFPQSNIYSLDINNEGPLMQLGVRWFKQGERSGSTLGKKKPAGMIKSLHSVEKNSVKVSNNEKPGGEKRGQRETEN